ncbi:hypothetical protein RQP54_15820 [Curvibacter sp. APW13]|uniref:hypothetical protein n=1 Tax=Curvibacter sp. APW13 TaxID=3077236 RepID=UPI0028DE5D90|nr:hypothetical protein [Curvibacter sp. APW13]MDT8992340.1 hypothetical protein [Curvibacter sp. APW13]
MNLLKRSAFAAHLLLSLGALLGLALGTLQFETAGGAVGYSTPVAVALIGLLALRILWLSFWRARDAGAQVAGALAAVVATVMFAPFVTLALLFLPSAPKGEGLAQGRACATWLVVLSLPLGAAAGIATLLLVQAVFKAL